MTGDLRTIPYHELDRHHEQARVFLREGFAHDEQVYGLGEQLGTNCRYEKVRRARERKHNDTLEKEERPEAVHL